MIAVPPATSVRLRVSRRDRLSLISPQYIPAEARRW